MFQLGRKRVFPRRGYWKAFLIPRFHLSSGFFRVLWLNSDLAITWRG